MPRLFIVSLGCPKNLSDAEIMAGELTAAGWELTGKEECADAALINTCAFLGSAVAESEKEIKRLLRLKSQGKISQVLVSGCLVEREKERLLARFPGLDAAVGIHALSKAAKALENRKKYILPAEPRLPSPRFKTRLTAPHSAYLKISDGCDNHCAYCLIPSIRGALRSKPVPSLAQEARLLAESGAVEISLIAQDTTAYGTDLYGRPRLAWLLRELLKIKSVRRWRLMYVYPERLTPEVIEIMRSSKNICRYLDMPLQHVSDRILRAMHRSSTERSITAKIAELRRAMPDIAIRTNFIVGFPGESQEDFKRLLAFVKKTRFSGMGVFKYSKEPGTSAAELPGQVPESVKEERLQALIRVQSKVVDLLNLGLINKTLEILMDSPRFGRTYQDAPEIDGRVEILEAPKKMPKPGELVKVKITEAAGYQRRGILPF